MDLDKVSRALKRELVDYKSTYTLILIISTVFFFQTETLEFHYVFQGIGLSEIHTTFTHIFLHNSLWHLSSNMALLWVFGRTLEKKIGSILLPLLFSISGVMAVLFYSLGSLMDLVPFGTGLGSSGATAGLMGFAFVLYPLASALKPDYNIDLREFAEDYGDKDFTWENIKETFINLTAMIFMGFIALFQYLMLFLTKGQDPTNFVHFSGLVSGILLALACKLSPVIEDSERDVFDLVLDWFQ